jgi:fucose 4-O-acetylase-like acetyltransferase
MSALPFFVMGYLFNNIFTITLVPNKWDKYLPIIIIACFALTFYVGGNCSYKQNHYDINPILQYVCGMAGTLGVFFTAKFLRNVLFITYWGRYSLMILVTHILLLQVCVPMERKFLTVIPLPVMAFIILIVVMFSYQLLIPLMKKYLPYFTAQKDIIPITQTKNIAVSKD